MPWIREATRDIQATLGADRALYHVGWAQFVWLTKHVGDEPRETALATLQAKIEDHLGSCPLPALANPTVGIVPFTLGEVTAETLLRTVHSAAQDARNADALVRVYSAAADQAHQRRFGLLAGIRAALEADDQLSLVYQPRIDLRSGACVGAEVLLRWHHPDLGPVSPGEFMPMVEKIDLVRPMTAWVIAGTLRQIGAWRATGLDLPISVNVSVSNLEEPGFAGSVIRALRENHLPSHAIEIEVTESALIRDGSRVGQQLQALRGAGIKVAIDDFGTGYSSLSYLQTLPADVVKIDQSFIRNLAGDERGRILVGAMVGMARSLAFRVVAEGVEDQEAYEYLRSVGCDEAQGYLISKPVPADAFAAWFAEHEIAQPAAA
jgi:EAL domain-containing protein (putative c-di-GMP-specific phosphodiesterase class I)